MVNFANKSKKFVKVQVSKILQKMMLLKKMVKLEMPFPQHEKSLVKVRLWSKQFVFMWLMAERDNLMHLSLSLNQPKILSETDS